jgi:colanic acid biosynthesis glycosyl transferase WcaI
MAEDLAEETEVHVLCGYPQALVRGSHFRSHRRCRHNDVTIHRVLHTRFAKTSLIGRLINMLTFQALATWTAFWIPAPDVVITETDPPFLCLLGGLLRYCLGCRHICYLQDVYPDVAVALGKLRGGWTARLLRKLFFAVYKKSDAVVVLSRDMAELVEDGNVSKERIHLIPNWVDTNKIYPIKNTNGFRQTNRLDDKFVIMYSGNIGLSQRLEQVINAASQLCHRNDIVFVFVGDGANRHKLQQMVHEEHLTNVRFFDYCGNDELADSLSAADLHLVILRPEVKQLLMPSKIYGILASGTPAIVLADRDCELAKTVDENDLGIVVDSAHVADLTTAIINAVESPSKRQRQGAAARNYALLHCDRHQSVDAMWRLLLSLTGKKQRPKKNQRGLPNKTSQCACETIA